MGGRERLALAEATALAKEVRDMLAPHCQRIEVAGSIRRCNPDVGDIELIVIPKTEAQAQTDMFGEPVGDLVDVLHGAVLGLIDAGVFGPRLNKLGRRSIGPDLKWLIYKNFALDIYAATIETWAVTMAIRTGPAEFSHRLVTTKRQGGLCPDYLHFQGWRVCANRALDDPWHNAPHETPEEIDVFHALGYEWLEPTLRTDTAIPQGLKGGSVPDGRRAGISW